VEVLEFELAVTTPVALFIEKAPLGLLTRYGYTLVNVAVTLVNGVVLPEV
jgi:hypothetical protein